jgi:aspartyl-tRNA(Asn)/glutamyl-tRNA(Gln) amidotransferase subunit B
MKKEYEIIVGLEVHAELKTASKIFCACPTEFGAEPNTQCCPVCAGLPGALPTLNRRAVELAVKAGLALNCHISRHSRFDRKQYFYPDLPKAYQVTQNDRPLCRDGFLNIHTADGERSIRITRIHLEEDAGKLIHQEGRTLVDCNRCGIPLIEIVFAPEIRNGAEASAYLRALRSVLVACGVSDCKMQEGSMRCDVNISVRPVGALELGVRTEIKNLNSFAFVEKAISYESKRQIALLESGEQVCMETLRYDERTGKTVPMRKKESSEDYRYLREPNLPMLCLSDEFIDGIGKTLPELPDARAKRMEKAYGLTPYDAAVLTASAELADYFEQCAKDSAYPKLLANLVISELLRYCPAEPFSTSVSPARIAELARMLGEGSINSAVAKKLLLRLTAEDFSPCDVAVKENLMQIGDEDVLRPLVLRVLEENSTAVKDFLNGKSAALRSLQGRLMALTEGRAHPVVAEQLLTEELEKRRESVV